MDDLVGFITFLHLEYESYDIFSLYRISSALQSNIKDIKCHWASLVMAFMIKEIEFVFDKLYLAESIFFNNEYKWFIIIGIQVCIFHCSFLFLSNPFSFWVQQLDLDIRIRSSSNIHLLQLLALQDTNCQLKIVISSWGMEYRLLY